MPQLQPSDPSSVMVIRDITPNITTFSLPFARFGVVKVGGRATLGMRFITSLTIFFSIPQLSLHQELILTSSQSPSQPAL